MVYVADLLRCDRRDGDLRAVGRARGAADGARLPEDIGGGDGGVKFFLPGRAVHPSGVLLPDVALPVAGIADGAVHDKLARVDRLSASDVRIFFDPARLFDCVFVDKGI